MRTTKKDFLSLQSDFNGEIKPTNCFNNEKISDERFVREPECKKITGLSRTRRWELEREGKFPKRIKLSERAIAWRLSDLISWMKERCNAN